MVICVIIYLATERCSWLIIIANYIFYYFARGSDCEVL